MTDSIIDLLPPIVTQVQYMSPKVYRKYIQRMSVDYEARLKAHDIQQ